jgi:hypothetical protein
VDVTVAAALVTTCTYTDTYDPLIVSGSFKYDGFMGPGGALVTSGADMATVSGPLASLGGVRSICEDSTWKATKTGGFSSVGFQWNGETYPFTWSNWTLGASDKGTTGSFFSKKYFERPHIANCAFATTAATFAGSDSSENPEQVRTLVPFTGNLLTLDHAATITVTFGNGQGAQIEIPSASGKPGRLKLTSKIVVKFAG